MKNKSELLNIALTALYDIRDSVVINRAQRAAQAISDILDKAEANEV